MRHPDPKTALEQKLDRLLAQYRAVKGKPGKEARQLVLEAQIKATQRDYKALQMKQV